MEERKELLAYCGLYCGDCAGYSGEIADSTKTLMEVMEKFNFEQTTKQLFSEQLEEYDRLWEMLGFMSGLRCPTVCWEREKTCEIGECCREKGFYACHECDEFENCGKLKRYEGLHGDAHIRNMRAINVNGLETWLTSGERHWFRSEEEDSK